jgi:hypothetical protein
MHTRDHRFGDDSCEGSRPASPWPTRTATQLNGSGPYIMRAQRKRKVASSRGHRPARPREAPIYQPLAPDATQGVITARSACASPGAGGDGPGMCERPKGSRMGRSAAG